MRDRHVRSLMLLPAFWLLGCVEDVFIAPAPPVVAARAAAIQLVSGDEQEGWAGAVLAEPLIVRVTDSTGRPLAGVGVRWRVISGEGVFGKIRFAGEPMQTSISTDSYGLATIFFVPTVLGQTVIEASVPNSSVTPATFTTDANVLLIELWYFWGTGFVPPCGVCEAEVPVGTPIVWVSRDADEWAVVASSAPEGGLLFDSGTLSRADKFWFVPEVPGIWQYEDGTLAGTDWVPGGTIIVR